MLVVRTVWWRNNHWELFTGSYNTIYVGSVHQTSYHRAVNYWLCLVNQSTHLHLANIGPFVIETLEERGDTEETPHPVVHKVSDAFAVGRKSDLVASKKMTKGAGAKRSLTYVHRLNLYSRQFSCSRLYEAVRIGADMHAQMSWKRSQGYTWDKCKIIAYRHDRAS